MRMMTTIALLFLLQQNVKSFAIINKCASRHARSITLALTQNDDLPFLPAEKKDASRRTLLTTIGQQCSIVAATTLIAYAANAADAQVTDRIYIDVKGMDVNQPAQRIVIGLFGKEAPEATGMLKALMSTQGLPAPCKPRETRTLQKEQLEANKVYNACIETEDKGVNYDFATIWRVIKDERIDVGAVSGKYVSRQYPTWQGSNGLSHDQPGVVSVRKGNDSGFGFTIYPGKGDSSYLDENYLVVGRVVEGMDVVESLNQVPVVTSAGAKLLSSDLPTAPSRSCRYGGSQLYCNEFKPLQKSSIVSTGVL